MVTLGALTEVTTVLRRIAKDRGLDENAVARDGLRRILAHAAYREAAPVDQQLVTDLYASESKLSLVDAWNIVASENGREPLLTFDRGVQRVAKARGA